MPLVEKRYFVDVIGSEHMPPVELGTAVITMNVIRILRCGGTVRLIVRQILGPRVSDLDL